MNDEASTKALGRKRSTESHEAILQAATELLTESGYAKVTMESVAERAGVGKQTIYRWWPTKIDLYIELYDRLARRGVGRPKGKTVEEDVREFAKNLVGLLGDPIASIAFRGMVAEAQTSKQSFAKFAAFMEGRFQIPREILRHAVKRGAIGKTVDTDLLLTMVGGGAVWRLLLSSRPLDRTLAKKMAEVFLFGIIPRDLQER